MTNNALSWNQTPESVRCESAGDGIPHLTNTCQVLSTPASVHLLHLGLVRRDVQTLTSSPSGRYALERCDVSDEVLSETDIALDRHRHAVVPVVDDVTGGVPVCNSDIRPPR